MLKGVFLVADGWCMPKEVRLIFEPRLRLDLKDWSKSPGVCQKRVVEVVAQGDFSLGQDYYLLAKLMKSKRWLIEGSCRRDEELSIQS